MRDPWRFECPQGHRSVVARAHGSFLCHTCSQRYTEVRDLKRDRWVTNSERREVRA